MMKREKQKEEKRKKKEKNLLIKNIKKIYIKQ